MEKNQNLSEFVKDFILLGLRLKHLNKNYIISYFGPPELNQLIESELKCSPKKLLGSCRKIQNNLLKQGFEKQRERNLREKLNSIEITLEIESGKKIPIVKKIKKIYGIIPTTISDSEIYNAVEELDSFYGGSLPLIERIQNVRKTREIPKNLIGNIIFKGMEIVRTRTYELFPNTLPLEEKVVINEVTNKNWKCFCRYKGNFESQIDINTDLSFTWGEILGFCTHEAYPGHHTEGVIKKRSLFDEKGYFEYCIYFANTPQSVIREGIGDIGINVLYSFLDQTRIALDLCPNPSKENLERLNEEFEIWRKIKGYTSNFAYHLLIDEWSKEELFDYARSLGFLSEQQIQSIFNFISDPIWGIYSFNYYVGFKLISDKFGIRPRPEDFIKVLTQQYIPSDFDL